MTPRPRILPKLETGVAAVDAVLRKWAVFLDGVLACPLLYGVLVSGEMPDIGETVTLRHNLGRVPVGWFVVDQAGNGVELYRDSADDDTITFARPGAASVDVAFTMWVY